MAISACAGALIATLYFFVDPAGAAWMPKCIIKCLTGLDCPGCGSQRFLHALLHADFAEAARANLLLFAVLPYIIFWIWVEADPASTPRLHRALNSIPAVITLLLIILIWSIFRNLY